jgi:hypothetical protein
MRRGGLLVGAMSLAIAVPLAPPLVPELAAEELPVTDRVITLPEPSRGAIVGDIDGDGVREVVRVVREAAGSLAAEAWRHDEDVWRSLGRVGLRRGAVVDELDKGFGDALDMVPLLVNEPARLVAWDRDGRERVLIATLGHPDPGPPCCLTLFELELDPDGRLALRLMPGPVGYGFGGATDVRAVDLDLDGTDELVVTDSLRSQEAPADRRAGRVPGTRAIRVLRWDDPRFSIAEPAAPLPVSVAWPQGVVDIDGVPGEELIYSVQTRTGSSALLRLRGAPDAPSVDLAESDAFAYPVIVPGAATDVLPVGDQFARHRLLRWPAGRAPTTSEEVLDERFALFVTMGRGDATRHLVDPQVPSSRGVPFDSLRVLGPRFEELDRIAGSSRALHILELTGPAAPFSDVRTPWPYVGPLPGGDEQGHAAYIFLGRLASAGPEGLTVRDCSLLVDALPVGLAGVDRDWLVAASGEQFQDFAARGGGDLYPADGMTLRLIPSPLWADPDAAGALSAEAAVRGVQLVAATSDRADEGLIYAGEEGFTVAVTASAGSRVLVVSQNRVLDATADESGLQTVEISTPRSESIRQFPVTLLVVTDAGEASVREWQVRVLTDAPELSAREATTLFALSARITGKVSQPATVLIDGEPAAVAADGAFSVEVNAPPWPRPVRVEAVDPLGRSSIEVVSVVGVIDYRDWPWVAIVALLTVAAGAVLYLRAGSLQRAPTTSVEREIATLEEIERS